MLFRFNEVSYPLVSASFNDIMDKLIRKHLILHNLNLYWEDIYLSLDLEHFVNIRDFILISSGLHVDNI